MRLLVWTLSVCALAQTPAQQNGSIGGVVKDEGTGEPIANLALSVYVGARYANGSMQMGAGTKEVKAVTDSQGRYRFDDLPPSNYRLLVPPDGRYALFSIKNVNLRAGQRITSADFMLPAYASIAGTVVDQNGEPVPGVMVDLLTREYYLGAVHYFRKDTARTDDLGTYALRRVTPGYQHIVVAQNRRQHGALYNSPADPAMRKPSFVTTFYPNVDAPGGASALVLRPGERREGVDIRLLRGPAFCVSGTLKAAGGPVAAQFSFSTGHVSAGIPRAGGMFVMQPGGSTAADGRFRVCDLSPGTHRLTAAQFSPDPKGAPLFASELITLTDRDIGGLDVFLSPGIPVKAKLEWEGNPPEAAVEAAVYLRPQRISMSGERPLGGRYAVPSDFTFDALPGAYAVTASVNSPGVYVKDAIYGGHSVLRRTLQAGSASDNELKVILAADGGSISVKVNDKDGNPVPDIHVGIAPADVRTEADLADSLVTGDTDQDGAYSYGVLPPGKYIVFATRQRLDPAVDITAKVWNSRAKAKVVEVPPKGAGQVTLEPLVVE